MNRFLDRAASGPLRPAELRALAIDGLRRMYLPSERMFAFHIAKTADGQRVEGTSRRYTATALIGLAEVSPDEAAGVLDGMSPLDVCDRLIQDLPAMNDIGEVALTLWASRRLGHKDADKALNRLARMQPDLCNCPTVELSWCLTSLSVPTGGPTDCDLATRVATRLMDSFGPSGVFSHWPADAGSPWLRRHVSCFADFVYPIQALSCYWRFAQDHRALELANLCGKRMCDMQGPQGQWWWHFDCRTGRVVERYPVYSIHQDSMAPMALRALFEAGGSDHSASVSRGLEWLANAPELGGSLVDRRNRTIWRKVARHEPGKLSRSVQALASRAHRGLRMPGLGLLFRPGKVDWETRPYHMGWILHAWRVAAEAGGAEAEVTTPQASAAGR